MDLILRSARIGCRCHYLTGVLLAGLSACSVDAPPPATVPSGVGGGQSQSGAAAAGDPTFTVSELQIAAVQPAMPKITAKVEFDKQARFGANDDRPVEPDRIRVDILFRGGDAETPASVGPGRIDELTVDNGAAVLGAAFKGFIGSGINLTPQEFDATYRPNLFDTSGMQLSVEFPQPAPLPVAITRLAGRVPLLVPRKRFSVTMTHAERLLETTWPVVAAGEAYLAAARGMDLANQPALDILCSSDARIINVCRLLDESGRPISGLEGPAPGLKNGGVKFQIPLTSAGGEPPARFDLQIELVTAFDKVEIPFRLENLPLGKPSTPVEEADAPAQWVASQVASPLKGVRVFGGFVWGPGAKESDGDGELPNVPQEFRLRLVGHEAAAAVECGKLKFDTVRTDSGATVELKPSFMQDDLFERLLPVEHAEFLSDHPLDGVWYKLSVGKVDQPVRMFERIEGTVVLVHADSTKAFRIPDPSQQPEGALTNPALDGAGLKCTWRKGEDGAYEFVMDEGNVQAAKAFAAVDELGKHYPLTLEWTADARGLRIQIPDPQTGYRPRRRELEIVVYQNLQETEIPFRFENVPLPERPRARRAGGAP